MSSEKSATGSSPTGWTSAQVYTFAVICLTIGSFVGYFLRESSPSKHTKSDATNTASMAIAAGQQPSQEQMRHMADSQAGPLLNELRNAPDNIALLAQVGNIYYDTQQYQEAIRYYDRALRIDPKNCNVRTDMATAFFYLGDSDRAISELQTSLKYEPKHGPTLYNLGMIKWQGKGDASGAVASWEELLREVPDYPDRANVESLLARAKQHTNVAPAAKSSKPAGM